MLLSALGPEALDALYPRHAALATMTPNSISRWARLKSELAEIHERALSFDEAESSEDVPLRRRGGPGPHRRDGGRHEHPGPDDPVGRGTPRVARARSSARAPHGCPSSWLPAGGGPVAVSAGGLVDARAGPAL